MTHVAFFRNLNLGHRGSPTGAELIEAFGGPSAATTFQTNGTVVFHSTDPDGTIRDAVERLRAAGHSHGAVVRTLDEIAVIVAGIPPVDPAENIYLSMISFFDAAPLPRIELPFRSQDGLVEVRALAASHAWSVCWKPRSTAGNVTGTLEAIVLASVITRTLSTLERLVKRFATGN